MSVTSQLTQIQQYLTSYGMATYTILGNIGLIFNIVIFVQGNHYRNPCSLYILVASISGLIGLNISVIPIIYAVDHSNLLTSSVYICQLQFYFRHLFNQMMRTFFILAYVDRYAITSNNIRIRSFNQFRIAVRMIIYVTLFWFILSIFPTMLRTLENGKCEAKNGIYSMIFSIYILIVLGIIPLASMSTFTVLLTMNLKQMRNRIQPVASMGLSIYPRIRKRDRDMLRMVLIEFIVYIITTIPAWILPIYKAIIQDIIKSSDRQKIESFLVYVGNTFLLFSNNSFSFWIYISASHSFRLQFKNLFMKCY